MKKCTKCLVEKPLLDFFPKKKTASTRSRAMCYSCKLQYDRDYWKKTKAKRSSSKKVNKAIIVKRNKEAVEKYLSNNPCIDCENADLRVLDFDHVRGIKKYNVCEMVLQGLSLNKIFTEIEKCEVRCSNCHRIVTHERRLNGT